MSTAQVPRHPAAVSYLLIRETSRRSSMEAALFNAFVGACSQKPAFRAGAAAPHLRGTGCKVEPVLLAYRSNFLCRIHPYNQCQLAVTIPSAPAKDSFDDFVLCFSAQYVVLAVQSVACRGNMY